LLKIWGDPLQVLNIYGPTHDWPQFWNALLEKSFLKYPALILGGDLNFSIGAVESWGHRSQVDSLSDFFVHKLEEVGLIDVAPIKISPTWRNKRLGEDYIAKRLDRFFISNSLVEEPLLFRQWTGSGGESDHFPIFLEIAGASRKPTSPFKFNSAWLKEESFLKLVKEVWMPIGHSEREVVQFARNLKELKTTTKSWEKRRKQQMEHDLIQTETDLQSLYDSVKGGLTTLTKRVTNFLGEKQKGSTTS
jgi:hypothetical protein